MYAAMLNKKIVLAVSEAYLVNKGQKKLNWDNYRCPHCNKKVILIVSEQKAAFFKHISSYGSALGEKEEHHLSKMLLKSALTAAGFNAQVEIPLADGQLRADVLASKKLAFEVQCAPLSTAEFNHRHNLYKTIGVMDIWIVGQRHYLKRNLKDTQLIFFRKNKKWGNYYLEVNPKRNYFCLKYNVLQEPLTKKLVYQTKYFALDEVDLRTFWNFRPLKRKYVLQKASQREYLIKQIRQKSKLGLRIGQMLYERKMTVTDLPDSLFQVWRDPGEEDSVTKFLRKKRLDLDQAQMILLW